MANAACISGACTYTQTHTHPPTSSHNPHADTNVHIHYCMMVSFALAQKGMLTIQLEGGGKNVYLPDLHITLLLTLGEKGLIILSIYDINRNRKSFLWHPSLHSLLLLLSSCYWHHIAPQVQRNKEIILLITQCYFRANACLRYLYYLYDFSLPSKCIINITHPSCKVTLATHGKIGLQMWYLYTCDSILYIFK